MPSTPLLGITQVTASQNNKEVTINDAIEALENATNANLAVDFSASQAVLLSDTQATRNFIFTATGATADSTLSFPAAVNGTPYDRALVVRNLSGFSLTVEITGTPGTTVIVPNNEARLLATINGTDVIVAAEPQSTVSFVSLSDTPGSLAGQQGRFLTVNLAEDSLEFADAATFPAFTNNAGKFLVVNGSEDGVEWIDLSVATAFLDLTDAPGSYAGQAGKLVAVNNTADGVEFIDVPEAEAVEFSAAQRWRVRVVDFNVETQVGFGEIEMLDLDGINLVGAGTASASTSDTGNGPEFAFDGTTNVGQGWLSEDGFAGTVWIEYDFGTAVTVRSMRLSPINGFPDFTPLRFVMEAFVDGAWLPLGDRTVASWTDNVAQTFKINGVPLSSVTDAASDNQPYVRRNGDWEAVDTDGTLSANSDEIVSSQKAVKTYVDTKLSARSWKDPVVAATTAAVTLASDLENGDTIDGVVLETGDRVLVKDQAAAAENGIYIVGASGAPSRALDADSSAELVGAAVVVSEGSVNADKQFLCTTDSPIVVDTDPIAFAAIEGGGGSSPAGSQSITEAGTSANLLNTNQFKYQRWTTTGAKTLTVQPNATEAIDQDAEFVVANRAASDDLTLVAGSGVTINAPFGGTLVLAPGMVATLKRVALDVFDLIGQTVAA